MTKFTKTTDRPVVATCLLGVSLRGTGPTGIPALNPVTSASLPVRDRNERPTEAPEAAVAITAADSYAFAATGAGLGKQETHHHTMWAFRGLEPWSDPV
jgi:hypothetical protein